MRSVPDRAAAAGRGRRLEWFTISWNAVEGVVAVVAGVSAGSISLVGFGADSAIEVMSGAALLWRMAIDADAHRRERAERLALRIVGACFLLLAAYVGFEAASDLLRGEAPAHSIPGILLAIASLIVMPMLSRAKRRVARSLDSGAMHADAFQTELCAYLSAILLAGLLLNAWRNLWWADPIAGLIMVPIIAREGVRGLAGHSCACD